MLLAIDCGNTNLVFAVYVGEEKVGQWRASTEWKRTADEYVVWLGQVMALNGLRLADIDDAIIASVVPSAMHALTTLCTRYLKTEPLVVGEPGVDIGVEVRVDSPRHVGADRLVNAASAHASHGGPLIVIDFGTATTFDVIGSDGAYEGGIIAPGVNTSLEALHLAAAKLPRIAIDRPPQRVLGQDTISAMQSGVYWGYVGLIEGLVKRIKGEQGRAMKVIATGGLAPLFAEASDCIDLVDGDLTLRGLLLIHRLNRRGGA